MTDKYELEQRLDKAEWVLNNAGFRRCDIPACNCGSWHQVGGFKARFDEIKEAIEDADYSTNGKILLDVVKEIIAEAKRPRPPAQRAPGWIDQNHQIDRYGVALMMIGLGCADPAGLATRVLSEFGVSLTSTKLASPEYGYCTCGQHSFDQCDWCKKHIDGVQFSSPERE